MSTIIKSIKNKNMECLTCNIAQGYKLSSVFDFLKTKEENVQRFSDVVFYQSKNQFFYIFSFGVIVFWNINSKKTLSFIKSLEPFADEQTTQFEMETFSYKIGNKTMIGEPNDTIILENDTDAFYKLALSYALAQSTKLATHEKELKLIINQTNIIPKNLAKTGTTPLKNIEISKKIGELYLQKWSINSHLNFMQTPKIIWDHSEIEPYYHMASKFLELHSRVESLNMGLTMMQDLMEILQAQLNNKHSGRMEWAVVLLICVEIILHVLHL